MTSKCGSCDFTNREIKLCPQCKEFQDEIVQNNLRAGESYKKLFEQNKKDS